MSARQRNTTRSPGQTDVQTSLQTARDSSADPSWRQPLPKSRADIRRRQIAVRRIGVIPSNPLTPVITRALQMSAHRPRGRWIALTLLVASAIGFSQLATNQYFFVTEAGILIRGNQRVSYDGIYQASGVTQNNVFLIRPEIAARQISDLPGMESATVHVRLPANVVIDVTELSPLAIVQTITETLWVGSDGSRIQLSGIPPELTLVEVSGTTRDGNGNLRPIVAANLATFRAARPEQTSIYYGALEGLYFRAPEGYTVYLGEEGSMAQKLALLEETKHQLAGQKARVRVVDLRFDGYALIK